MKIGRFFKDKIGMFAGNIFLLLALYLFGYAFQVNKQFLYVMFVLVIVQCILVIVSEYVKKRKFYKDFLDNLEGLDQKYLVTEMISVPDFLEGIIMCDALYEIDKSMKERINYIEETQKDLKEYIELWIHEIKIPIATLSCMNYNENWDPKKLKEQLDKLNYYVEQILFLSRADDSQKDYLMKEISLEKLVNQVVKGHKELLRGNRIQIRKNMPEASVVTDTKWMEFILGQIVNNSVKYSIAKKDATGIIEFEAVETKVDVTLSITDYGIGICQGDLSRVFEKTFTGENGRKLASSTGMGLYICYRLCEKLGHQISIESQEGEYTKVSIRFGKDTYYR